MKLIVNADDFGMDESTTRAILKSFELGAITQTTLIVNSDVSDQAVAAARCAGIDDRIGLHLNLAEGSPLTDNIKSCRLFCDEAGVFNREILKSFESTRAISVQETQALEGEVRAQIEKFLSYGLPMRHCDGHHHFEFTGRVSRVLMPILKQYGFKTVRRKPWMPIHDGLPHVRTRIPLWKYWTLTKRNALKITDGFAHWHGFCMDIGKVHDKEWVELMTHPRYVDGQLVNVIKFDTNEGPSIEEVVAVLKGIKNVELRTYLDLGAM